MPIDNNMPRFSDAQLSELCKDFEQHKEDFEQHKIEQDHRWDQLALMVENNTKATGRIADAVEKQAENTAGIVQLYQDLQGAARLGEGLKKFLAWLITVGTASAVVAASITYVLDYLQ